MSIFNQFGLDKPASAPKPTAKQEYDPKAMKPRKAVQIVDRPKGRRGRPPVGGERITIRLDPEVIAKFKATGPGWQARMNEVLKKVVI